MDENKVRGSLFWCKGLPGIQSTRLSQVDVLTRDFLEKWRRMEVSGDDDDGGGGGGGGDGDDDSDVNNHLMSQDVDVEVNPLNRSTVEIFTNVPHLISMQEDGDDDDNDEQMGIKIFKLHVSLCNMALPST